MKRSDVRGNPFEWLLGKNKRGAGGARPPVFASNSLKSPLNWPKYAQKLAPNHLRPLLFQILDPPLPPYFIVLAC